MKFLAKRHIIYTFCLNVVRPWHEQEVGMYIVMRNVFRPTRVEILWQAISAQNGALQKNHIQGSKWVILKS